MRHPTTTPVRLLDNLLLPGRLAPIEALGQWLLVGDAVARDIRLAHVRAAYEQHPRREELAARWRLLWSNRAAVQLLAETGIPTHHTLLKELVERGVNRVIPRRGTAELVALVGLLPFTEEDAGWLESLPLDRLGPLAPLVSLPPPVLLEAAALLALRSAGAGLARELLELEPDLPESASPYFGLPEVVNALVRDPADDAAWAGWTACQAAQGTTLERARRRLEIRGVSTDLLFRLELLEAQGARLDLLLRVATGRRDGRELAAAIVRGSLGQRGLHSLARNSMRRLARKVVEHTGETGERYVVTSRLDWDAIRRSALWGGALTAFTALFKYGILGLPLAPLFSGLAVALNYTVSFIIMQLGHLTLASKQPAMTAAALATALEHHDRVSEQVELVAGITRSQVVATLGNVLGTIPVAVLLAVGVYWLTGAPPLDPETAEHAVHGLHPLLSWSLPFAALTGVYLWLASLAAGWAANWSAFRGLPEGVAAHPGLRRATGVAGAERLGGFMEHHLGGILGYVALGSLMGFMPVLFRLAGLTIEVRHVTLHAGSLALGTASLLLAGGSAGVWGAVAWGSLGIILIGACNFGVSFALALRTAMRARELTTRDRLRFWAALRKAFRERPGQFLLPPPRGQDTAQGKGEEGKGKGKSLQG